MPRRPLVCTLALFVLMAMGLSRSASADNKVKKQVATKIKAAMESYDLLEYEEAKKGLTEALMLAKRKGLGKDKATAAVHMYLGVVYFSGFEDGDAARLEFVNAVELSPSIEVPKAYRTKEMAGLLDKVKAEFSSGGTEGPVIGPEPDQPDPGPDCSKVKGVVHELVEEAPLGSARDVEAFVGRGVKAAKVALYFRPEGEEDFEQLTMGREGQCKYTGRIPAESVRGGFVHYYVAALNKKGRVIDSRGSKGSPNIIEVKKAAVGGTGDGDGENPMGSGTSGGGVSGSVTAGDGGGPSFFIALAAGSGAGYVTGETEAQGVPVDCCVAPALLHIFPEVGFFLSPRTTISVAFRIGFPVGANVPGHAQASPAALLRLRHALASDGTGFSLSAGIGGGIVRHTLKISDAPAGMDTDTTATGPLLASGGVGYIAALGDTMRFVVELNGIVGVPIIDSLGTCPGNGCVEPNFGFQVDANLGFLFAF